MSTSPAYLMGLAVGILLAVVVLAFVRRRLYGNAFGRSDRAYDERQLLARGEAYKAAFFTALGWMIVSALIRDLFDTSVQMTMGICLSVGVFAVICIKKDAYLSLREKPAACIRWFLILAAINILPTVMHLLNGSPYIEDGMVTHRATNLIVAVMLIVVTAAVALRQREIRKELAADESDDVGEDA